MRDKPYVIEIHQPDGPNTRLKVKPLLPADPSNREPSRPAWRFGLSRLLRSHLTTRA
jgi:hypothetical protein